jgi:putative ABC transport system substrate-binding protein
MRRRELIFGTLGALAATRPAWPQQPDRPRRIGVSMSTAENEPHEDAAIKAFVAALARAGWETGRNVEIVYRWGAGEAARMAANARELVALAPDAILREGRHDAGVARRHGDDPDRVRRHRR